MTLELAAVIAIGAIFLMAVLVLVERVRWRGSAARPARAGGGSQPMARLGGTIRNSVVAWLLAGLVRRAASIVRRREPTDVSMLMAHRPDDTTPPPSRPVPVRPTRIVVSGERQPALVPVPAASPTLVRPSPRRRLWRDATAVLVVLGALATAVYIGAQQPQGGVLGTTATPPASGSAAGNGGGAGFGSDSSPASSSASLSAPALLTAPATGSPAASATLPAVTPEASALPTDEIPGGAPSASGAPSPSDPSSGSGPGSQPSSPPARVPAPAPTRAPTLPPVTAAPAPTPAATPSPTTVASPPVAHFVPAPQSGIAPLAVQFSDRSTGSITRWSWDFGDGRTSTGQNPTHTFAAAGTYGVTLTVTGPGGSDSYAFSIVVTATPAQ